MSKPNALIASAKNHLATGILSKFIGRSQRSALAEVLRGEERAFFAEKLCKLAELINGMPHTYQQDGLGEKAIVYLHYFAGGAANWWITEKDMDGGTQQAFGKADLFGDGGELGYISIDEIVANNGELDLYWTPKTVGECKA
jgi:hypothetical protein